MATNPSPTLKKYQYTYILQKNEIRVLHLQPGEPNDTIVIEIAKEVLNDKTQPYHALSWEWGERSHTKSIRAKESKEAEIRTMNIRSNLYVALKHLRFQDKVRRLWVDAICINQTEPDQTKVDGLDQEIPRDTPEENMISKGKNDEKSRQIAMMNKIYGLAKEVCVWLGEESEDSGAAMRLISDLAELKDFASIRAARSKSDANYSIGMELYALIRLLKRGWFSRRWVIQVRETLRYDSIHLTKLPGNCSR
jgi:Heterokaryon incompatibility protein (HET)